MCPGIHASCVCVCLARARVSVCVCVCVNVCVWTHSHGAVAVCVAAAGSRGGRVPQTLTPRSPPRSPHVRQHLRQRVSHHPAAVLWHRALPHADAPGAGVHPLPPDPQPAAPAPGGVLPARLVLHQRHRHERGEAAWQPGGWRSERTSHSTVRVVTVRVYVTLLLSVELIYWESCHSGGRR